MKRLLSLLVIALFQASVVLAAQMPTKKGACCTDSCLSEVSCCKSTSQKTQLPTPQPSVNPLKEFGALLTSLPVGGTEFRTAREVVSTFSSPKTSPPLFLLNKSLLI